MPAGLNHPLPDPSLVACRHCDLLQRLPELPPGASARCPRCEKELWRRRPESLDRTLALGLAAGVLFAIANLTPMLGLEAVGRRATTTVFGGAEQLWLDGREIVAVLVFGTVILAPALQIALAIVVGLAARRDPVPRWVGALLRHHPTTRTWSMIEVLMVGVLVALIKIAELATVVPGIALWSLGALVFVLAAMQASFDPHEVWARIEWVDGGGPDPAPAAVEATP
jgi:paraquat-inducible protein A